MSEDYVDYSAHQALSSLVEMEKLLGKKKQKDENKDMKDIIQLSTLAIIRLAKAIEHHNVLTGMYGRGR